MARTDKAQARQLRLDGRSYNDILRLLGIPKGTLSGWFHNLAIPPELQRRLYDRSRSAGTLALVARNKRQTVLAQERARRIKLEAASTIGPLSFRDLLLIGSALYWAEGRRTEQRGLGNRIGFSNSDPAAVRIMMRFLREICRIPEDRFRIGTNLYPGMDIEATRKFWSQVAGVPLTQFHKSFVGISKASQRKRPANRLPYGTCQIVVNDTRQLYRVLGWIAGIQRSLNGT